jgi:uncharacterized protein YkwD
VWLLSPSPAAAEPCRPQVEWCAVAIERMTRLVNAERARQGLSELDRQDDLSAAAATRLREVERRFSHQRPTGSLVELLDSAGESWTRGGENLGRIDFSGDITAIDLVHQHLMGSGSHRNNILAATYRHIGISVSYWRGFWHFVQLFAG